jgi:hypothetical protein
VGKTYQTTVIAAPAESVWKAVRDFHNFDWAPGVITKVDSVGDKNGTEVGAKRILNDAFQETLLSFDDSEMSFSYSIDDGPSPVSKADVKNYVGRVSVHPITEGRSTFVEWSSSWTDNDEAASQFCHGIYVALLGELKKHFAQ